MANPRIDELKRRIEREPGSRLFAQLAEELRKEGELVEAIRVARTGLAAHPNYPSARLTLGRALFESGQLAAARVELEAVLRGAADNIVAARMLGECLEGLGDVGAALLQYRAALRLSPGDRQIEGQIRALEQKMDRPSPASASTAPMARVPAPAASPTAEPAARAVPPAAPPTPGVVASAAPARPASPPPPPAPAPPRPPAVVRERPAEADADFDSVFEPAPAWKRPSAPPPSGPNEAILLLDEDEAPTLPGSPFTRPPAPPAPPAPPRVVPSAPPPPVAAPAHVAPAAVAPEPVIAKPPAPPAPATPMPVAAPPPPMVAPPPVFAPPPEPTPSLESATTAAFKSLPFDLPPMPEPFAPAQEAPVPPAPPVVPAAPEEATPPLSTPTLAELYFDQGFYDKAVQVYEQVLEREPHNERVRARLVEIKALARSLDAPDPKAARRLALQNTISRLEQMLTAVRRG